MRYMLLTNLNFYILVTNLFDVAIEMYESNSLKWSPLRAETCRSDPLFNKAMF